MNARPGAIMCAGVKQGVNEMLTHVPRTQRSAISAFTRVFDALWLLRSGALQSRGRYGLRVRNGPGSAERHEECRTTPGTRELSL
jgi:hypothetical protein